MLGKDLGWTIASILKGSMISVVELDSGFEVLCWRRVPIVGI